MTQQFLQPAEVHFRAGNSRQIPGLLASLLGLFHHADGGIKTKLRNLIQAKISAQQGEGAPICSGPRLFEELKPGLARGIEALLKADNILQSQRFGIGDNCRAIFTRYGLSKDAGTRKTIEHATFCASSLWRWSGLQYLTRFLGILKHSKRRIFDQSQPPMFWEFWLGERNESSFGSGQSKVYVFIS